MRTSDEAQFKLRHVFWGWCYEFRKAIIRFHKFSLMSNFSRFTSQHNTSGLSSTVVWDSAQFMLASEDIASRMLISIVLLPSVHTTSSSDGIIVLDGSRRCWLLYESSPLVSVFAFHVHSFLCSLFQSTCSVVHVVNSSSSSFSLYSSLCETFHDVAILLCLMVCSIYHFFQDQWLRDLILCLVHSRYLRVFVQQTILILTCVCKTRALCQCGSYIDGL